MSWGSAPVHRPHTRAPRLARPASQTLLRSTRLSLPMKLPQPHKRPAMTLRAPVSLARIALFQGRSRCHAPIEEPQLPLLVSGIALHELILGREPAASLVDQQRHVATWNQLHSTTCSVDHSSPLPLTHTTSFIWYAFPSI